MVSKLAKFGKGGLTSEIQIRSFPGNIGFGGQKMEGSTTLYALYGHVECSIDPVIITNLFFMKFYINIMRKKSQLEKKSFFFKIEKKIENIFSSKKWKFWKCENLIEIYKFLIRYLADIFKFLIKIFEISKQNQISNFQIDVTFDSVGVTCPDSARSRIRINWSFLN